MKRRPNSLPEWTRTIWASQTAKEVWEPRVARIGALTNALELLTVVAGNRRAAWIFVGSGELEARQAKLVERGLNAIPLLRQGITGSYSASGLPYEEGQPYSWRCLVCHMEDGDANVLVEAFRAGDDEVIGEALGYPKCCRDFFARVWVREQWLDTTWPMAQGPRDTPGATTLRFEVSNRWPANILGRWFGVRAVPWLPCSFTCADTMRAWRERWEPLAPTIDAEALEWLETLLRANWRWSALHGIGQIETSIAKISTRTDTCDELHTVDYVGVHELEAGTTGTRFPYHTPIEPQLTKGRSFAAGLEALETSDPDSLLWEQNGFASVEGMDSSHDVLLRVLREAYTPGDDPQMRRYLMDPGCGNGLLLEKLGELFPGLIGCGIECIRERALAAYERIDRGEGDEERIVFGTLGDLDNWRRRDYELALMMPGRLLELEPLIRDGVLFYLQAHVRRLLVYAYNDQGYGSLEGYAEAAGLLKSWRLESEIDSPGIAMAGILCRR